MTKKQTASKAARRTRGTKQVLPALKGMADDLNRLDMDFHRSQMERLDTEIANLEMERYGELIDTHNVSIRPLLMAILEAQDTPWDKAKQFNAISWHLAAVLSNPCLPKKLRCQLSDSITEFHNDVRLCFESPTVLRTGGFVPLLAAGFDPKSTDPADLP